MSITAGIWYSLATIAPWDRRPPTSEINPPARANKGDQPASVWGTTIIVWRSMFDADHKLDMTLTVPSI